MQKNNFKIGDIVALNVNISWNKGRECGIIEKLSQSAISQNLIIVRVKWIEKRCSKQTIEDNCKSELWYTKDLKLITDPEKICKKIILK